MKRSIKKQLFFILFLIMPIMVIKGMKNNNNPFEQRMLYPTVVLKKDNELLAQFLQNREVSLEKLKTDKEDAEETLKIVGDLLNNILKNNMSTNEIFYNIVIHDMKTFIYFKQIKEKDELERELDRQIRPNNQIATLDNQITVLYLCISGYKDNLEKQIKVKEKEQEEKEKEKEELEKEIEERRLNPGDCAICYDSIQSSAEGEEKSVRIWCGHKFHKKCIDRWARDHDTCPVCRAKPSSCRAQKKFLEDRGLNSAIYQRPRQNRQQNHGFGFQNFHTTLRYNRDDDSWTAEESEVGRRGRFNENRNRNTQNQVPYNPGRWVAK